MRALPRFVACSILLTLVVAISSISAMADEKTDNGTLNVTVTDSVNGVKLGDWDGFKWMFISRLPLDQPSRFNQSASDGTALEKTRSLGWYATGADGTPTFEGPKKAKGAADGEAVINSLSAYIPNREFWSEPMTVAVGYVTVPDGADCPLAAAPDISFKEDARQSAFMQGVMTLVASGKSPPKTETTYLYGVKKEETKQEVVYCLYANTYVLTQDRASLTVTVTPAKKDEKSPPGAKASLLTGSPETFFFTTDVAVKNAKELELDPKDKTVTEKDKPNNLMVGLNALWGDPYTSYDFIDHHRFAAKLFADASTPLKDYGLGIGYVIKTGSLTPGTENVGALMIFGGYERTVGSTGIHHGSWIWGLSFNLNSLSSGK